MRSADAVLFTPTWITIQPRNTSADRYVQLRISASSRRLTEQRIERPQTFRSPPPHKIETDSHPSRRFSLGGHCLVVGESAHKLHEKPVSDGHVPTASSRHRAACRRL